MESVIVFNLVVLWLIILLVLWLLLYSMRGQRTSIAAQSVSMREPASIESLQGTPAPPFAAWTLDQKVVSHTDYQGHETLFIFLSTTCQHCRNAAPEIERVGEQLQRRGGKVALVFGEAAEEARAYYEHLGMTLPVLIAPREITSFTRDYNRRGGVPAFVAINSSGIVTHEGVVNRREEAWRTLVHEWQIYPLLTRAPALYY
ncbi:MAG TPA: redoxin domain-containing protein [Ktedonobacteraceae bacterium]|nr:redoxin domain-containing protein [Ktedonobacteraceae bacterium]